MNLIKFIYLFKRVKALFSYLPLGLQEELVGDMESALELCLISKQEKERIR